MKKNLIMVSILLLALITTNIRANELVNSNKISSKQVTFIQNNGQLGAVNYEPERIGDLRITLGMTKYEIEEEEILFLAEMYGLNIWVCNDGLRFEYYEFS